MLNDAGCYGPCPVCDDKTYIYAGCPQILTDCPACAQEQTVIKDEAMRTQAFNTMKALEAFALKLANLPFELLPEEIRRIYNEHTKTSDVPGPTAKTADQLARAIALLTMKVFEKKVPFDNAIDAGSIYRLLGIRPCEECRGSGWLARDESCKTCKRHGWLNV